MNNNTPDPNTPWNDIVDDAVFNLMDREGGNTHAMHSLLSSLVKHGFIDNYVIDDTPSCDLEASIASAEKVSCPCKMLDPEGSKHFMQMLFINIETSHSAWLVHNLHWGHSPFVLMYATPAGTRTCCDHVIDHPTPRCEILSNDDFKPFARLGKPGFIVEEDYKPVALLLVRWILDGQADGESWKKA